MDIFGNRSNQIELIFNRLRAGRRGRQKEKESSTKIPKIPIRFIAVASLKIKNVETDR